MQFGRLTQVGPTNLILDGGADLPGGRAIFWGKKHYGELYKNG